MTPDAADEIPTDWETTAQRAIGGLLRRDRRDADEALGAVARQLTAGEAASAEELRRARETLRQLQITLEEEVAPTVDGVEPYERAADHIPFSALAETHGIELEGCQDDE